MKRNTKISCVTFTLLFVLQLFMMAFIGGNASITNIPLWVMIELVVLFAVGAIAVRLFAKGALTCVGKKALAATAVLYSLTIVAFYGVQLSLILTGLNFLNPMLGQNVIVAAVVLAIKVLLLAAGVYFAVANEKEIEAEIEFETPVDAAALETPEAVESITEQLDEKEV